MARVSVLVPWYTFPPFRSSGIGGLSVVVWELSRALAREGAEVGVLVPSDGPVKEEVMDGVSIERGPLGDKVVAGTRLTSEEAASVTRRYDYVLSVGNFGAGSLRSTEGLLARVRRQVHMVAHDRALSTYLPLYPSLSDYGKMFIQRRREKRQESELSGVPSACVSRFVADKLVDCGLAELNEAPVVPNGVDRQSFRPATVEKRFDLLFVGRYQVVKGLDILLGTLPIIKKTLGSGLRVGIVGEFNEAQKAILNSKMGPEIRTSVNFLGTVDRSKMPETLNSSRFLIIPSRYESFGLPALEAMSCGIPVIASRVGGLPEVVNESVGLLVDSVSPSVLAEAIVRSMRDSNLEEAALRNGPERAASYDWGSVARRTIDFLKHV